MEKIKVLQYNVGHCRAATAEMEQKLIANDIDGALVS